MFGKMFGRTQPLILKNAAALSPSILPQPLIAIFGENQLLTGIVSRKASKDATSSITKQNKPLKVASNPESKKCGILSSLLRPESPQYTSTVSVASSGITSYQQKEMTKPREETARNTMGGQKVAMEIVKSQLADMVNDIHTELDAELLSDSELAQLAKYVFSSLM